VHQGAFVRLPDVLQHLYTFHESGTVYLAGTTIQLLVFGEFSIKRFTGAMVRGGTFGAQIQRDVDTVRGVDRW
jgi:hypothetical protein